MNIFRAYRKQWATGMYAYCAFKCPKCGYMKQALCYTRTALEGYSFRGPCGAAGCPAIGEWHQIMWPAPPVQKETASE